MDNLVCPAVFDTGAVKVDSLRAEGDDKPRKYPRMFGVADVALINKIGLFDCDIEAVEARAKMRNPNVTVIPIPAKTGEGIEAWTQWQHDQVEAWQE